MGLPNLIDDSLLVGGLLLVGFVVDLPLYLLQKFFILTHCVLDLDQLFFVGLDVSPAFDYDQFVLFVF